MPKGNDNDPMHNTLHIRTEFSELNMTAEERSPSSIRERNRRPDKQLYVPKARRLGDGKEKETSTMHDALLQSNRPRKVLSTVQNKKTEEMTGAASHGVKDENARNGRCRFVPRDMMKVQPNDKKAAKFPLQHDNCVKAMSVGTPLASSDRSGDSVAKKKVMLNDRDRIIVQKLPFEIGHSSDQPKVEMHENRHKKTEKLNQNNQVSSAVQTTKHKTRKPKPTCDRTIVSNRVGSDILSAAVKDASAKESEELYHPDVLKPLHIPLSSLKQLDAVGGIVSSQNALRLLSEDALNVHHQVPPVYIGKTDTVSDSVQEDDICLTVNNRFQCSQIKNDISPVDGVNEPECDKNHEEATLTDATAELPLEVICSSNFVDHADQGHENKQKENDETQPEGEFSTETCQISSEDGMHESSCSRLQLEIIVSDSGLEIPLEFIRKMDDQIRVVRENEIMPVDVDGNQSDLPKVKLCNEDVGIVMEDSIIESDCGRVQPEIALASAMTNILATDNAVRPRFEENDPGSEVTDDKDMPLRTIIGADKCRADSAVNATCSSSKDTAFGPEDSWDAIYDDSGECLDKSVLAQLTSAVGNVSIEVPQIDYLSFQAKEPQISDEDFGHVVEIYNFPVEFKTEDLMSAFSNFKDGGFNIKWVNDTHALAVFSSRMAAEDALTLKHPIVSTRPLSQGIKESKLKARRCAEFMQPYKPRPETSALLARLLVTRALGMHVPISQQQREERRKLGEARERKNLASLQRQNVWNGNV